ncbi:MAG: FkbM family methyltransferase [Stagnimonas sp.]|nr:FkbM family methyltransferase [Stagnimonas sp.]
MNFKRWLEKRQLRCMSRPGLPVNARVLGTELKFLCRSDIEVWRVKSAATKEAGTVAWIGEELGAGDVFCDIGANIGLYTLMAASRVGARGAVYAFEPHAANFQSLLRNIAANNFGGFVRPFSCALHDSEGVFDFNYQSFTAGSSMSQLGATRDGEEREFLPVVREAKLSTTLDRLVQEGAMRPPTHIKLDVDGNELPILRGMRQRLVASDRPRSLQVEVNQRYRDELMRFLGECGYRQYHRHDTADGLRQIAEGRDKELVAHNALFRPS